METEDTTIELDSKHVFAKLMLGTAAAFAAKMLVERVYEKVVNSNTPAEDE